MVPAFVLLSLAPLLVLGVPPIWTQPEQVHLSYPGRLFELPPSGLMCFHSGVTIFPGVRDEPPSPAHVGCRFADDSYKSLNDILIESTGIFIKLELLVTALQLPNKSH